MEKGMKGLILASVSAIALGLGGVGTAHAWGYSGSAMGPTAPTYYPGYSSYGAYSPFPRYIPGNAAGTFDIAAATGGGAFAFLTHAQVAQAQQELARAGDYTGPVNGVLDPATSEALADWQSQHNLPTTGGFNPPTMASLGLSTAPPYYYMPGTYAYGYGYDAHHAYQGSSDRGAETPSGAGGTTTGAARPGRMPPPNATAGQDAGAGGPNLPNNVSGGAAAPAAGNATGGQGTGGGAANPPSNTNSGAAAPQH
jgi:peptidoglycan hydrolase-like protein with peptidoglycan-binding domain